MHEPLFRFFSKPVYTPACLRTDVLHERVGLVSRANSGCSPWLVTWLASDSKSGWLRFAVQCVPDERCVCQLIKARSTRTGRNPESRQRVCEIDGGPQVDVHNSGETYWNSTSVCVSIPCHFFFTLWQWLTDVSASGGESAVRETKELFFPLSHNGIKQIFILELNVISINSSTF